MTLSNNIYLPNAKAFRQMNKRRAEASGMHFLVRL